MRHWIQSRSVDPFLLLRAFACLLVIGSHVQRPELHAGLLSSPFGWIRVFNGHFGVWIFFILSGYLIGKGFFTGRYVWSVHGLRSYYLHRVTKVYVPYVITAIVLLLYYRVGMVRFFSEMTSILLLRGNDAYGVDELSYLWTISSIVLWYVIAPAMCRILLMFKNKKRATFFLGVGILITGQVLRALFISRYPSETFPEFNAGVFIHFLPNFYFFLMGAWVNLLSMSSRPEQISNKFALGGDPERQQIIRTGLLRRFAPRNDILYYSSIAGVFIAYLVSTYYLSAVYVGNPWSFAGYGMIAPFLTILSVLWWIIVVEKEKKYRSLLFPLSVIGTFSYQLYLMQTPIIKILSLECAAWCPVPVVLFRGAAVVLIALGLSLMFRSLPLLRRREAPSK